MISKRVVTAGIRSQFFNKPNWKKLNTPSLNTLTSQKYSSAVRSSSSNAARSLTSGINSYYDRPENNLTWMKAVAGAAVATGLVVGQQLGDSKKTDCCGIAAVIGKQQGNNDAR